MPFPYFSLSAAADLPGPPWSRTSTLSAPTLPTLPSTVFRQSVQEVLVAIFEGVCERVFGSTFALQSPENPGFFRRCAVPWVPDFFHAPVDQGAPSGPPQNVGPSSRSLGHPLLLLARFPREGASAIRTRSGRLSAAPHHLRPSETLSTGRGASRRRPASVAASGSSLTRPDGGGPHGRSLDSTFCPLGRERSLCSWARASPSLSRFRVQACEAVFPSPAVHRRLAAPCVPPCSFPCL